MQHHTDYFQPLLYDSSQKLKSHHNIKRADRHFSATLVAAQLVLHSASPALFLHVSLSTLAIQFSLPPPFSPPVTEPQMDAFDTVRRLKQGNRSGSGRFLQNPPPPSRLTRVKPPLFASLLLLFPIHKFICLFFLFSFFARFCLAASVSSADPCCRHGVHAADKNIICVPCWLHLCLSLCLPRSP